MENTLLKEKLFNLKKWLAEKEKVAVAFSGGVDSTFLLKIAHDVLKENAVAVTARINSVTEKEINDTIEFCTQNKINHYILDIDELSLKAFKENPVNRCYFCKKEIFTKIKEFCAQKGFYVITEGTNKSDENDYRPGVKAIEELNVFSPLKEFGFTKDEIRLLSKEEGLKTFNKPSKPCLASRVAFGEEITKQKLEMVKKAEAFLEDSGFKLFRVRVHGTIARIEVINEDVNKIIELKDKIDKEFRSLGFNFVTLDLRPFKSGSMNEAFLGKKNNG